jgi:hypothetical protein
MEIIDFIPPVKTNEYTPDVQALIDAGEGKAARIVAPANDAAKAQRLFQKAANMLERTAKLIPELTETEGEGDEAVVKLTFTLTKRHKARRNAEREAAKAEAPTDAAPVEEVASAPEADAPADAPEPEPTPEVHTPRPRKRA